MKNLTLYFPAVGGEPTIAAVQTLRASWPGPETLRIVGSDVDPNAQAKVHLDNFFPCSSRNNEGYLDTLLSACDRYAVDVLWPNPPEEQLFVYEHLDLFRAAGVRVLLGSRCGLDVFCSKHTTYKQAADLGIPSPQWLSVSNWLELKRGAHELGYPGKPVIFRPTSGKGAFGVVCLSAEVTPAANWLFGNHMLLPVLPLDSLAPVLNNDLDWPACIVCEYLPGREYEVDCYCDSKGLKYGVVREHHAMWGGTAAVAEVVDREDLVAFSGALLGSVSWTNICSVQFKDDEGGRPALLEVNPRMASNVALPVKAGVDLPLVALLNALGRRVPECSQPKFGVRSVRYLCQGFLAGSQDGHYRSIERS